ncbi:MAG: patatin-like phospholipase family protein [Treponemataceae bacterium]
MKWALVLSGGGAKGFVYLGMLRAFQELKVPQPDLVFGCSIGSIIGSMVALGKSPAEIETFFTDGFDAEDYLGSGNVVPLKPVNRILNISSVFSNLITGNSMDDGQKLYLLLKKLTEGKNFSDTTIPFMCNAVDLHSGNEIILHEGELAKAVLASSAYPVAFPPVRIGSALLVDGGIGHNTPVCLARESGFETVFAVTLDHFRETSFPEKYPSAVSVLSRAVNTIFKNQELQADDYPDFWLDLSTEVESYDFSHGTEQVRFGYLQTVKHKKDIEAFFSPETGSNVQREKLKEQIKQTYRI